MTFDREGLKRWYREAMQRRLEELRDLRDGLRAGDPRAFDTARDVGQALRGSGATYGFAELSAQAGLLESASDKAVARRVEGLVESLRRLSHDGAAGSGVAAEWLTLAGGGTSEDAAGSVFGSLTDAWQEVGSAGGRSPEELAQRVADYFDLRVADPSTTSRAALRLVTEALMADHQVIPLREDAETITVATADPTSLALEGHIQQLTGRTPIFTVAPPEELSRALAVVLVDREGTPSVTRAVPGRDGGSERWREGHVLIVDDDPAAVLIASRMLEKGGYQVVGAEDGLEALERLRESPGISLIVADLNMPRLDGLELLWEMRAEDRLSSIPVIVVTGETDEILETKLIEEGADDYIRKPLDPRLFLARVAATIRRAEH